MNFTRRHFLETLGKVGGAAAVYEAMTAMGMIRVPDGQAQPLRLSSDAGKGRRVVILGAGIAGLTAAYELQKGGFHVTVLEAQKKHIGGRNYTVRRGDQIVEFANGKKTTQTCEFAVGQYLNAGPGRIPYHHTTVIDYCKQLGVKLEIYVMSTRANLYQTELSFEGKPLPNRHIANDTRGWIAELLAKAVDKGAIDQPLSEGDRKRFLGLLTVFGDLDKKTLQYKGSSRSGYTVQPGVLTPGTVVPKLDLIPLLRAEFWRHKFYQPEDYEWQPTLFQPVGGMDGIVKGFLPHVQKLILQDREVVAVTNGADGVEVVHRKGSTKDDRQTEKFDWCISTIPLPIFHRIIKDNPSYNAAFQRAVAAVPFAYTCKVGWQASERFWQDKDEIYGGISYIDHPITQMWYPSANFFDQKRGVLTGAYNYDEVARKFGENGLPERLRIAAEGAKRLHPDFDRYVPRKLGLSIAWHNVPFQEGGWANWDKVDPVHYNTLLDPDKRVFIAGDQVSYLPGWQEGAMLSAQHVIRGIVEPPSAFAVERAPLPAPSTRAMTQGRDEEEE
ncbi:MAG TPA: FAD-dependent oxidoreductase [Thermoanaerobaculia bacterium]|nr:FAD-dependent oxidoreductase [Thermoanaerobaculia bacterium]